MDPGVSPAPDIMLGAPGCFRGEAMLLTASGTSLFWGMVRSCLFSMSELILERRKREPGPSLDALDMEDT